MGRNIITALPEDGLSIGKLIDLTLHEHDKEYRANGVYLPTWRAVTETGNIYHQALISVAEGLGTKTRAVQGFADIGEFDHFLADGGGVLLSVQNTFINAETLRRQKVDQEEFKDGTHIISILNYNPESKTYTVFDPYGRAEVMQLTAETLNKYLPSTPRAIALAKDKDTLVLTQHIPDTPGIYRNEFLTRSVAALLEQRKRIN